jgi:hypothetical protein
LVWSSKEHMCLISIDFFLFLCGGGVLQYPVPKWLLLHWWGEWFSLPSWFSFFWFEGIILVHRYLLWWHMYTCASRIQRHTFTSTNRPKRTYVYIKALAFALGHMLLHIFYTDEHTCCYTHAFTQMTTHTFTHMLYTDEHTCFYANEHTNLYTCSYTDEHTTHLQRGDPRQSTCQPSTAK